ncbi:unnamed protein product, partial [Effrenium voratum]
HAHPEGSGQLMARRQAPQEDLFRAASAEWERLQLYGKYFLAAKQQEQARLLEAVAQLTGETVEALRPKYRAEQDELQAFASTVQKVLATTAAAARMRETKQAEKVKAKQEEAKTKVEAMDLNQVVAASVTQSSPAAESRSPKSSRTTWPPWPIAESAMKEKVLSDLLATAESSGGKKK